MRRITVFVSCICVVAAWLFIGRWASTQATANITNVCGPISSNATWSLINSPYDVCPSGVTIGPTATLTIEPGVTVQFENGVGNKLNVLGALVTVQSVFPPHARD